MEMTSVDKDIEFCRKECAENDYPFYLMTLFQQRGRRLDLWALGTLRLQLENIVSTASQPTLAYMRLTWWRDETGKLQTGAHAKGQPLLNALTRLPVEDLQNYINSFETLVEGETGHHTELFDNLVEKIIGDKKLFAKYKKQNALVKKLEQNYRGSKWQGHPPFLALRLWLCSLL